MNAVENYKVWEIKALKRSGEEEAKKILEKIAKQVQPIMRKHKWRVQVLSEFYTYGLLGLNMGAGVHVKLKLRDHNRDWEFLPFDHILDTMLHELCHNVHGPHDAKFYKLWDELRKECDELRSKGITGIGGFDLSGRRLGGISPQPPLSSLRQTVLNAAEKRSRLGSQLPAGPKRLGGDRSTMVDLSPIQAAAMAAERRLQDDLWCGSQSSGNGESTSDILEEFVEIGQSSESVKISRGPSANASNAISRKRSRESNVNSEPNFVELDASTSMSKPKLTGDGRTQKSCKLSNTLVPQPNSDSGSGFVELSGASSSASLHNNNAIHGPDEPIMWGCEACTFMNHPLIPICEVCSTPRPKDGGTKNKIWTCKFCTLENCMKLEKCSACDQWRYSRGPPMSTRAPYLGT